MKDLIGKSIGGQFSDDDRNLKVAIIQRVDEINMKVDLKIITGTAVERIEVPLTQAMVGPRSFLGGIPEKNSLVLIAYRRIQNKVWDVNIVGYLAQGARSSLHFNPVSPQDYNEIPGDDSTFRKLFGDTIRFKRMYLQPGDVGGMSSRGGEFAATKDFSATNRAGDSVELRDDDRTYVQNSIHSVSVQSGIRRIAGPIRRGAFFLPDDIFESAGLLKSDKTEPPYYGRDELAAAGPGVDGSPSRFADSSGKVLPIFNDFKTYPPVTYSSGRRVHYPPTVRGTSVDDIDSAAMAYVEDRLELSHTTDLVQEVLEEIEGFSVDRKLPYIEKVLGTIVGNTLNSTEGQRQYSEILKPKLFEDFTSKNPGKFTLEAVDRKPTSPDIEANTVAGAYLLRIRPPEGTKGSDSAFVFSVSKQGKFFLQAPGSTVESFPSGSKNISGEVNLLGALKAFIGASAPDRVSIHLTTAGGVHLDLGRDSLGNAVTVRYHSGVKSVADGNPNEDDLAREEITRGTKSTSIFGKELSAIDGSRTATISGMERVDADRYNLNAISGMSMNAGELSQMISGKTQINYAQQYQETLVTGGKITTIMAGGDTQSILVGAKTTNVLAGTTSFNNPAGSFSVNVGVGSYSTTVGTGSITFSAGTGAVSMAAAAGLVAFTSGLAMNLTAGVAISMVAPQILFGGPAAVLGVVRGTPSLPPGSPSLDIITNLPLFGSALVRSI